MRTKILLRKLHRWAAILTALPFLLILTTGMLLQFKKESAWIQPPTRTGSGRVPEISFARILEAARTAAGAGIQDWEDIERLDVRPGRGVVKVRGQNRREVQIDTTTGEVLQVMVRRSDLIESLHDGSFFHDRVKLWIWFPLALVLTGLWGTGLYLWLLPYLARRQRALRS